MQLTFSGSGAVDYGNAHYLATASLLAYTLDFEEIKREFADTLALTGELHSQENTQVFAGWNDTDIVIAFRGSESPLDTDGLKDWLLTNANIKLIVPGGKIGTDFLAAGVEARFHKGFIAALDTIWEAFFQVIDAELTRKERPVWVTGHSLGGALATLAAWRLKRKGIKIHQVYTFGVPMFCNIEAVEQYNLRLPNRIHRFVNERDVVPLLPISDLLNNEYSHVGAEEELGMAVGAGGSAKDIASQILRLMGSLIGGNALPSIRTLLLQEIKARANAHSLSQGYIAPIADVLDQQAAPETLVPAITAGVED